MTMDFSDLNPRCVLVLDDDPKVRHLVTKIVLSTLPQMEIIEAESNEQARATLNSRHVVGMVLDFQRLDGNTADLFAELMVFKIAIPPSILFTGTEIAEVHREMNRLGLAFGNRSGLLFVSKPETGLLCREVERWAVPLGGPA